MKALSLTQPYAELIKNGCKTIETRSWKTDYRGKLLIHASSTKIPKASRENIELMGLIKREQLDYGSIICSCELVDCIKMTEEYVADIRDNHKEEYISGIYEPGRYAWIFRNIKVFEAAISAKGHLGLWSYEDTVS